MEKRKVISTLLPALSIALIFGFLYFTEPQVTGLAIGDMPKGIVEVDADVTIQLSEEEIIPEGAGVVVSLDKREGMMGIKEFILRTGKEYRYDEGKLEEIGYEGYGFTGNFSYELNLSDFNIERRVKPGEHHFVMRIVYLQHVLLEKSEDIMVR